MPKSDFITSYEHDANKSAGERSRKPGLSVKWEAECVERALDLLGQRAPPHNVNKVGDWGEGQGLVAGGVDEDLAHSDVKFALLKLEMGIRE